MAEHVTIRQADLAQALDDLDAVYKHLVETEGASPDLGTAYRNRLRAALPAKTDQAQDPEPPRAAAKRWAKKITGGALIALPALLGPVVMAVKYGWFWGVASIVTGAVLTGCALVGLALFRSGVRR